MSTNVSIIIPAYNVENYIEKCLYSAVNQTMEDIEIIVINDGSCDKTLQKIEEFSKYDSRIIIINKKNEGVQAARRDGIEYASGQYILFLDSDDL